jgi:hypothetical protein
MSYSSVNSSAFYLSSVYWAVSIRLAFSDDNGASWQDPGATENERWKLIWFQYLNADLTSYFAEHSWIALKMAATPQELVSATPVKLFGGVVLLADGSNTGSPVFSPLGGVPAIQLNSDLSRTRGVLNLTELTFCIFTEPGLHATTSALYLTIYCTDVSTAPLSEYLAYFRCGSPCDITNKMSWEYLGRLLTPADGQLATGFHHYQAPALVTSNDKTYLLATPVDRSVIATVAAGYMSLSISTATSYAARVATWWKWHGLTV